MAIEAINIGILYFLVWCLILPQVTRLVMTPTLLHATLLEAENFPENPWTSLRFLTFWWVIDSKVAGKVAEDFAKRLQRSKSLWFHWSGGWCHLCRVTKGWRGYRASLGAMWSGHSQCVAGNTRWRRGLCWMYSWWGGGSLHFWSLPVIRRVLKYVSMSENSVYLIYGYFNSEYIDTASTFCPYLFKLWEVWRGDLGSEAKLNSSVVYSSLTWYTHYQPSLVLSLLPSICNYYSALFLSLSLLLVLSILWLIIGSWAAKWLMITWLVTGR